MEKNSKFFWHCTADFYLNIFFDVSHSYVRMQRGTLRVDLMAAKVK